MARDITIRYIGDSASAERAAARVRAANDKLSSGFAGVQKSASENFRKVGRSLTSAGRSITTFATLPIAGGFAVAIKAASDLNEQTSKMRTVFGDQAPAIERFANTAAKNFGLSKVAAFQATGQFGNMFQQLGLAPAVTAKWSQSLTTAASDLASFHNADITQVLEAQQAAFRGEYDALQRFIPTINAANVQQRAMEMSGKANARQLTESEKAAATYALMIEGMGAAQGDFARTSDSAANQQRILQARFQNLAGAIGTQLLPIAMQFGEFLAGLLDKFNRLTPTVQKFILIGAGLLAILGPVVGAIGALATVIGLALSPVGLVIVAFAALALGIIYAYKHSETFRNIIAGVMDWITGTAVPAVQGFAASFMDTFRGIGEAVTHAMNVIRDVIGVALTVISALWGTFGETIMVYVRSAWGVIQAVIQSVLQTISGIIKFFIAVINGDWGKAWEAIKQILSAALDAIMAILKGFVATMAALLRLAWEGIKIAASAAWGWVKDRITGLWGTIKTNVLAAATWVKNKLSGIWDSIKSKVSGVWTGISNGLRRTWDTIKGVVRGGVNAVIGVINGLIGGVNWVLRKLKIPEIPKIGRLREARSADLNRPTREGMATGGVVPLGRSGPFVTNGPMTVVGEGRRSHPEYVIPTDPQYRGRALGLLGQLSTQLLPATARLPGLQFGGIIGAFKGGFNFAKDKLGGLAGSVLRKALEVGFAPFNKAAEVGLSALPNPLGVRDIAQKLRETVWDWVKGADSALPTRPPGGGRARGAGLFGLHEPVASMAKRLLELANGQAWIISGWRSFAQQQALYARYLAGTGNLAAKPGTSKHEQGLAVDWGGTQSVYQSIWRSLGGHFPVRGEPWHGEAIGYRNGTNFVPRDGMYRLHRGEAVTPARANRGVTVNITVQGSVISERELTEVITRNLARQNGRSSVRVR